MDRVCSKRKALTRREPLHLPRRSTNASDLDELAQEAGPHAVLSLEMQSVDVDLAPERPAYVIGPDGEAMALADLPCVATRRWVPRRKAQVVAAVHGGLLTSDEACTQYAISIEELAGWQRAVDRSGLLGLRVTRTQDYRARYAREQRFT